jgi:CheY-like chemotaxis protein
MAALKLLVVEDDPANLELMTELFEQLEAKAHDGLLLKAPSMR